MDGTMVGRDTELKACERALAELKPGAATASVIAVAGEPGIGKSRLLEEVSARASERGVRPFAGRAAQFEHDVPYAVFVEALDPYLGSQNPRRFEALGEGRMAELSQIFPAFEDAAGTPEPVLQAERYKAHRAFSALVEHLAVREPVLVALDDVQWADEASLELIAHLCRRPPRAAVLLWLGYRSGEASPELLAALDEGEDSGVLRRLDLAPLSTDEATALIGSSTAAGGIEKLHRESGGNPFYLEQLLRAHGESPAGEGLSETELEAPEAVRNSLARELGELDAEARALFEGAAVAGDPFRIEIAAAAGELGEAESLAALDRLAERELVRSDAEPGRFRFRHPIVRRAVYEAAKPGWRLGAHRRVREAMTASGSGATEVAHHVAQAATPGDEEAVALLLDAGAEAYDAAPAAAEHWFSAALGLMPSDMDPTPRVMALGSILGSQMTQGRIERGEATALELMELLPPNSPARLPATVACASLRVALGRHREARELMLATLAAVPEADAASKASLEVGLATLGSFSNDFGEVEERAKRGRELAEEAGDRAVESAATSILAAAAMRVPRTDRAQELSDRAAELFDSLEAHEAARMLEGALWLCANEFFLERTASAIARSEWALELARSSGQAQLLPMLMMSKNWSLNWEGRLEEARAGWEEMLELTIVTGNVEFQAWALSGLTEAVSATGDLALLDDVSERCRRASQHVGGEQVAAYSRMFPAQAQLERGDPEGARRELLDACGGSELEHVEPAFKARTWLHLTRAEVELGNLAAAQGFARAADESATSIGLPGRRGWGFEARAHVERAEGRLDDAVVTALEAAAFSEEAGLVVYAARQRLLAGACLADAGEKDRAVAELRSASEALIGCGAHRYADAATRELRRLGESIPTGGRTRGATTGTTELSPREQEIAELVAEGMKNREIAGTLFLSEKTIEKHLSKIYAKLEISGRAAVGARLRG